MKIKFLYGLGTPRIKGSLLSRAFKQGMRVHDIDGISPTLSANMGGYASGSQLIEIEEIMKIRRLTPVETERLMSWPDNWTKYGKKETGETYEMSDSRRYKLTGNGIVSNVSKHFIESLLPTGNFKVMSICSGADGSCLALDKDRFQLVGFSEFDKYASDNLRYNYPDVPNFNDLTKIETNKLPEFDILFGSLPCQPFSQAGNGEGFSDIRGTLFYDMARILKDRKTDYFVFENVKGLLSHDKGKTFEVIVETFSKLGYDVDFEILNAKHFGVPQNRERVFMFGKLKK